ncbi:MAG: hypothetical protein LKM44_01715 [Wolbachia endosymbiont of Meromenopon meropis]|nr:hypothetical protein [Wolbachia endosymbiont of Meromenopon meropis]
MQEFVQSLNDEKDRKLCRVICKGLIEQSQRKLNESVRECKQLFKQEADTNVLSELKKLLITEQEKYQRYYLEKFLPELLQEIIQSEKLIPEKIEKILKITLEIIKQNNKEEFNILLSKLETKIIESARLSSKSKVKRKKIVMKLKISDSSKDNQISIQDNICVIQTSENIENRVNLPSSNNKKDSPLSVVSNTSDSISAMSNLIEVSSNLQKEKIENQIQSKHLVKKRENTQESKNLNDQISMINNDNLQRKNEHQQMYTLRQNSKEKSKKKQENENLWFTKRLNSKNFCAVIAACYVLLVGCFVIEAEILRMMCIELLILFVGFTIVTITQHLTLPSSRLTSNNLNFPHIENSSKQL